MKKNLTLSTWVLCASVLVLALSGCPQSGGTTTLPIVLPNYQPVAVSYDGDSPVFADEPVIPITVSGTYTVENLTGQNVFLVRTNSSTSSASTSGIGKVSSFTDPLTSRSVVVETSGDDSVNPVRSAFRANLAGRSAAGPRVSGVYPGGIVRHEHEKAAAFNSNPSAWTGKFGASRSASGPSTSSFIPPAPVAYTVGTDTRQFWVENASGAWVQITATLRAEGDHSLIWVADANYDNGSASATDNKLTTAQINSMRNKFDLTYPLMTSVFGDNYAAGTTTVHTDLSSIVIGASGEKVSILVYDIYYDYTPSQNGGVLGYFWGKDLLRYSYYGSSLPSNEAEIFYIDAHFADLVPDVIYSTLVHEFQHMIHFAQKSLRLNVFSDTWYNEMLSMISEDMMLAPVGIPAVGGPIEGRIPYFNAYYDYSGVTDWLSGNYVLMSYSSAYAFGAYLARNYGGPALIEAIAQNNYAGTESITQALRSVSGDVTHSFNKAFSRYGEALLFSGAHKLGKNSFDTSATGTINGQSYTFSSFDIWSIDNVDAGNGIPADYTGPTVWNLTPFTLRPYGMSLQTHPDWLGVTGDLSIRVTAPTNSNVKMFLMVR